MAILMILVAGIMTATSNFFLRRSIDGGGSSRAYLALQVTLSIFVGIGLGPMRTGDFSFSSSGILLGLIAGLLLGGMLFAMGRAIEKGPAGLTIASVNASTVVPAVLMALIFGSAFQHGYEVWHAIGSILVVAGLYWAGWATKIEGKKVQWALLAMTAFVLHALLLCFLQWRALLLKGPFDVSSLVPFRIEGASSEWFMPALYFSAAMIQLASFIRSESRWPTRLEWIYGSFGAVCNAVSTYFLIAAPMHASQLQNAMMFPLFSVTVIVLCNVWGQGVYKEKVNWIAAGVCMGGIVIGTVDWSSLLAH